MPGQILSECVQDPRANHPRQIPTSSTAATLYPKWRRRYMSEVFFVVLLATRKLWGVSCGKSLKQSRLEIKFPAKMVILVNLVSVMAGRLQGLFNKD